MGRPSVFGGGIGFSNPRTSRFVEGGCVVRLSPGRPACLTCGGRVVNARGFLSIRGQFLGKDAQRALLLAEGVAVGPDFIVIDFPQVRWSFPPPPQ